MNTDVRTGHMIATALALAFASTAGHSEDWNSVYRTVKTPAAAETPAQTQP